MAEEVKQTKQAKEASKGAPPKEGAPEVGGKAEGVASLVVKKKKIKKNVVNGIVHIQATFNNTIITISDTNGNVLCWATSGGKGFKGSKKGTPFAAQLAAEDACRRATDYGMRSVVVYVRGPGAGRESAVRAVAHAGLRVSAIRDLTPIPHNGCRPPKKRRV